MNNDHVGVNDMRNILFAFLLLFGIFSTPTEAGLLTRGNIFAEGLAGCAIGVGVGLVASALVASQGVLAAGATRGLISGTAATVANVGIVGGCVTGAAVATAVEGLAEYYGINRRPPMVYPMTPKLSYE
jgi:hypothetical protein